jgi:hypothetical protein
VAVEGASNPLLVAYRHVLANEDDAADQGVLEKESRAFLKAHRKEFLERYGKLEDEERDRRAGVSGIDVEEKAARDLLVKLLAELDEVVKPSK